VEHRTGVRSVCVRLGEEWDTIFGSFLWLFHHKDVFILGPEGGSAGGPGPSKHEVGWQHVLWPPPGLGRTLVFHISPDGEE
jgi:hypothetical protein